MFLIPDPAFLDQKGVYAYRAGEEIKYFGRCRDSMRKRINQGYGKIHPKNCYIDGQATNCHLNAEVTAHSGEISLWLHPMNDDEQIMTVERQLIRTHRPPWNIQR